jgi:hypothetical protein
VHADNIDVGAEARIGEHLAQKTRSLTAMVGAFVSVLDGAPETISAAGSFALNYL